MQTRIWSELLPQNTNRRAVSTRLVTPRRALVTAGVAAVLLAALTFAPNHRANVAFAQVIRAMQAVQTVHYHNARYWVDRQGHRDNDGDSDCWVRWQPMLSSVRDGRMSVVADEQQTIVSVRGEEARVRPHTPDQPSLRQEIMEQITAPAEKQRTQWQIEQVTVDGQTLLRFEQNWTTVEARNSETIWAEPDSLRVVRSERSQYNIAADKTYLDVCDQFRYNETPPAEVFAPLATSANAPPSK